MNKAGISYKDIGDYLSREEKLRIVREDWSILNPDLMKDLLRNIEQDNLNEINASLISLLYGLNNKVLHFIPTHSSWLNLVERWFAEITNKRIRRGSFESVPQLICGIKDYIKTWNKSGRSFSWTKTPEEIFAKINKAKSF
jgi:transposase